MRDFYLRTTAERQPGETGSMANIYVFSVIGLFILLIAIINFMNLSTARSMERAKEVGVLLSLDAFCGFVLVIHEDGTADLYLDNAQIERLALLVEELGETQQAIGKILRHGYNSCHPKTRVPNKISLERELGDVAFAVDMLIKSGV